MSAFLSGCLGGMVGSILGVLTIYLVSGLVLKAEDAGQKATKAAKPAAAKRGRPRKDRKPTGDEAGTAEGENKSQGQAVALPIS